MRGREKIKNNGGGGLSHSKYIREKKPHVHLQNQRKAELSSGGTPRMGEGITKRGRIIRKRRKPYCMREKEVDATTPDPRTHAKQGGFSRPITKKKKPGKTGQKKYHPPQRAKQHSFHRAVLSVKVTPGKKESPVRQNYDSEKIPPAEGSPPPSISIASREKNRKNQKCSSTGEEKGNRPSATDLHISQKKSKSQGSRDKRATSERETAYCN